MKNQQQQTCVTQHDLELLHKKIIATDLIVQKYQEANKALLRLQVDNDDLKERIDQMENECSIFGKQVTECTQESDYLKKQIELINNEKNELRQQIRTLQDENVDNQHEIMVLRQFESLKDTNDQLNKTVERQQKMISKLQLQVQRKSPVFYKPNRNLEGPSEAEIALTKSQKSVLELKLALGRLMNFIELSKIEVPSSLLIRPVLKAHDINDNFLESEHVFVHKRVRKKSVAIVRESEKVDDTSNVPAPIPVAQTAIIESTTEKKPKKSRRKKVESESETLANALEMALSKQNQEQTSQMPSLFSDDEDHNQEDKTQQSDTQQTLNTQSTISFFTDDETSQELMPPPPPPPISTLQVDHLTPMEVDIVENPINSISFLSEDEEEINQTVLSQEYILPVVVEKTILISPSEPTEQLNEILPEINTDSSLNKQEQIVTTNIIDPKHSQVICRLLNILTQLPIVPFKHLRLARRRIKPPVVLQEQLPTSTVEENQLVLEQVIDPVVEIREELSNANQNGIENFQVQDQQQPIIPEITGETIHSSEDISVMDTNTNVSGLHAEEEEEVITSNEESQIHTTTSEVIAENINPIHNEEPIITEENMEIEKTEQPIIIDDNHSNDKDAIIETVVTKPQEVPPVIKPIQAEQPLSHLVKRSTKSSQQNKRSSRSSLKPYQLAVITRLLHTLTTLPITPLVLPSSYPQLKRKRTSVVPKLHLPPPPPPPPPPIPSRSMPITRSSRSLNSIRACITRCNQPLSTQQKRTTTQVHTSPSPITKRRKPNPIEQKSSNSYDLIEKYLQTSSKDINEQLREFLDENIQNHLTIFIDRLYDILDDFLLKKCDIILILVTKLHSYEESIENLFKYIQNKSSRFSKDFCTKLQQKFQSEIQQSQPSNKRIEILNRLLFVTCSISSESSSSSVVIYARLFDIAYSSSHEILVNCLTFLSSIYPTLISANSQTNSSNVLLHQILIDLSKEHTFPITFEYLQNLLISYRRYTHDQEDLLRCFLLIFRYQTWSWCSQEFYKKIFHPLLNQSIDQSQRLIILMILQYILFIYKNNEDFQRDHDIHQQIKQQLKKIKTRNRDECDVREKILSILSTCC